MSLSIKNKVILSIVLPMAVSIFILTIVSLSRMTSFSEEQLSDFKHELIELEKEKLRTHVDVAFNAIRGMYENADDQDSKDLAMEILNQMSTSNDGYIFGYRSDGIQMFNQKMPERNGKSVTDMVDPNGVKMFDEMMKIAKTGDGFLTYHWENEKTGQVAPRLSYALWLPRWNWLIGTGEFLDGVEANITALEEDFASDLGTTVWISTVISVVLFGLFLVGGFWMSNSIVRPLNKVKDKIQDIAQGEGDLTHQLDAKGNDEVAQLSASFNELIKKIHDIIVGIADSSEHMVQSSDRMNQHAISTLEGVERQKDETDLVVTSMQEMQATSVDVSQNANAAADAARSADSEGRQARKIVNEAVASIEQLAGEIESGSNVINELENEVNSISSVLDVIRGIAEQTNLLALNAAIEAARAGEQGRGFAVVADEVRTLASRTQDSTLEIQDMIEKLQDGTKRAVSVMDGSKSKSVSTVEKAKETDTSLDAIEQAITTINDMNNQIATAAEEQSAVAANINENVNHILEIANETADATSSTAKESQDIVVQSQSLLQTVSQFRVNR